MAQLKPQQGVDLIIPVPNDERWRNRDYVIDLVAIRGEFLRYASDELKADRELVMVAITNDQSVKGVAFRCCSRNLKGDRDIVLAAVSKRGELLKFAFNELKDDREVVLKAIANDHSKDGLPSNAVLRCMKTMIKLCLQPYQSTDNFLNMLQMN
jgi:hypothetical protein